MYRLFCFRTIKNCVCKKVVGTVFALIKVTHYYCTYKITVIFVLITILHITRKEERNE